MGIEKIGWALDQAEPNLLSMRSALEACLDIHKKYEPVRDSYNPYSLYMLIVLRVAERDHLEFLKVNGPVVSDAGNYTCIGAGEALGNYFVGDLYSCRMSRNDHGCDPQYSRPAIASPGRNGGDRRPLGDDGVGPRGAEVPVRGIESFA